MTTSEFDNYLDSLLSPTDAVRIPAESFFKAQQLHPNVFASQCLFAIRNNAASPRAELAVSLLRNAVKNKTTPLLTSLSPREIEKLQSSLTALLSDPTLTQHLRKRLIPLLVDMSNPLYYPSGWPKLPLFASVCTGDSSMDVREVGFLLFTELCEIQKVMELLKQNLDQLAMCLGTGMQDTSGVAVRVAAVNALTAFLCHLDSKDDSAAVKKLTQLVGPLTSALGAALGPAGSEENACSVLSDIAELAESQPLFFKGRMAQLWTGMIQLAHNNSPFRSQTQHVSSAIRRLAVEICVSLAESRPTQVRISSGNLVALLIDVLIEWLLSGDDLLPEEWNNFEDPSEDTDASIAEDSLSRLASAIRGRTMVPLILPRVTSLYGTVPPCLAPQDAWKAKHAALLALGCVARGCGAALRPSMKDCLALVSTEARDPNPRVCWAAQGLLTSLLGIAGTSTLDEFADVIVDAIKTGLTSNSLRVKQAACASVCIWASLASEFAMKTHIKSLLELLLGMLGNFQREEVLDAVLLAVKTVAEEMGSDFGPFYDAFVPPLLSLLRNADVSKLSSLRCRCIECFCVIGAAAGREKFSQNAHVAMEAIAATPLCDPDDPNMEFLEYSLVSMAECLKSDFAQFLPAVINPTLMRASAAPETRPINDETFDALHPSDFIDIGGSNGKDDVSIDDDGDVDSDDDSDDEWKICMENGEAVEVHTSQLENKAKALSVLRAYATSTGVGFNPYVDTTLHAALTAVSCQYNVDVRQSAFELLPAIVSCVIGDPSKVNSISSVVLRSLDAALKKESTSQMRASCLDAMCSCIEEMRKHGFVLSPDELNMTTSDIAVVLDEWGTVFMSGTDSQDVDADVEGNSDDNDEEEEEDNEDEEEDVQEILDENDITEEELVAQLNSEIFGQVLDSAFGLLEQVCSCAGSSMLPYFESNIEKYVVQFLRDGASAAELHCGFTLWGIVAMSCGPNSPLSSKTIQLVPLMIQHVLDSDTAAAQSACFCLGAAAASCGSLFSSQINAVVSVLAKVIREKHPSHSKKSTSVYQHAVCALGYVLLHHHEPYFSDYPSVYLSWTQELPLRNDPQEAHICNNIFLDIAERQSELALSPSCIKDTARIALELASQGNNLLDMTKNSERLNALLRELGRVVPELLTSFDNQKFVTPL